MTRVNRIALALAVAAFVSAAPSVRADLLDEDEDPKVLPTPSPEPLPDGQVLPVKTPAPVKTPTPKGQTVLPPKGNTKQRPGAKKERLPVHFESKGLKGLREKGTVELMDDVVVTQGDFRLESDFAQVFFDEAAKDVVKVVAEGNVKIYNVDATTGEKMRVFANQGTFLNRERIVTVDGNVRLWRGEDSVVRMKKATYEMDSGWIRGDRVAGEVAPSEKDQKPSNPPKEP